MCLASVLVVLGTTMVGCTACLKGRSGPVAWQATDLRVIERSVSGAERDIYAFSLVLEETQGSALTPDTAKRLGVSPAADALKHMTTVILWMSASLPGKGSHH
jgi:hypothetical protein